MAGSGVFPKVAGDTLYAYDLNGVAVSFVAGSALGTILYGSGTSYGGLAAGGIGSILTTSGTTGAPYWSAPTASAAASTLLQGSTFVTPGSLWLSGIATGYRAFLIEVAMGSPAASSHLHMQFNADTGNNYTNSTQRVNASAQGQTSATAQAAIRLNDTNGLTGNTLPTMGEIFITNGTVGLKGTASALNIANDQHLSNGIYTIGSEINLISIFLSGGTTLMGSPTHWAIWGLK